MSIVVLEDYGNNLVQEEDNNINGVDEMASILWDIIVSWKSKYICKWQKRREWMILDWSQVWLALHEQEESDSKWALIKVEDESRIYKWGNIKLRSNDKGHNSYWI